jgi:hypothetical protein
MTLLSQQERRVWTRQPQAIIPINWRNPITRGLVGVWVPTQGQKNLVGSSSYFVPTNKFARNGRISGRFFGVIGDDPGLKSSEFGFATAFTTGVAAGQSCVIGRGISLNDEFGLHATHNNSQYAGAVYCGSSYSIIGKPTGSALADNTRYVIGAGASNGVGAVYLNGEETATASGLSAITTGGNLTFGIQAPSGDSWTFPPDLEYLYVWNRKPSALEFKTIAGNPDQVFSGRRTRRYISLGAGGTNYTATLTATTTSAASILKAAKAQRQASTTAAAAIAKAAVSSKAAAVTSSATLARSAKLTRSATAVASAAVSKLAAAMRSATTTGSATLGTIKAKLLTLTASVTNSATARRAVSATRAATTTAAGTLARAISTTKAALTTASGTIGKVVATTKAAATASMATVATVKAKLLTLAASLSVSGAITKTIKITRSGAVSLLALLERLFISGGGGPAEIFAALTSKRSERNSDTSARPKAQAQRRPKQ